MAHPAFLPLLEVSRGHTWHHVWRSEESRRQTDLAKWHGVNSCARRPSGAAKPMARGSLAGGELAVPKLSRSRGLGEYLRLSIAFLKSILAAEWRTLRVQTPQDLAWRAAVLFNPPCDSPPALAVASDGSVYTADAGNSEIRRVRNNTITTISPGRWTRFRF